jgi:transposase
VTFARAARANWRGPAVPPAIKLTYCLAHPHREFLKLHKQTKHIIAEEALHRISEVYAIEPQIRGNPASERVAVRQAETKPLMEGCGRG